MKPEFSAVRQMSEGLTASGMPEQQANAVMEAISTGMQAFSVTPEMLHEEILPIKAQLGDLKARVSALETRVGNLEVRMSSLESRVSELSVEVRDLAKIMHAGFEAVNARIFWLIVALLGTMGAMMASMITVLVTNNG
ncbi:MAG: hypothetical protein OXD00_06015 [Gammaproteobacteria bacterium]|nr:hypothetical protein [Gammaproteobacteria bacterium]